MTISNSASTQIHIEAIKLYSSGEQPAEQLPNGCQVEVLMAPWLD